jgi:hypothetical protein
VSFSCSLTSGVPEASSSVSSAKAQRFQGLLYSLEIRQLPEDKVLSPSLWVGEEEQAVFLWALRAAISLNIDKPKSLLFR